MGGTACAFVRYFEDLVVHDAIVGNKQAAADRYGISWRAVNNMFTRLAHEALGRVDLLDGLVAVAIDEVKYKKGHRYPTVVCDHVTGRVVWAAKGRSKETVGKFFDVLGDRAANVAFVTADSLDDPSGPPSYTVSRVIRCPTNRVSIKWRCRPPRTA